MLKKPVLCLLAMTQGIHKYTTSLCGHALCLCVLPVWDGLPPSEACTRRDGFQRVSPEEKPGPEPHTCRAGMSAHTLARWKSISPDHWPKRFSPCLIVHTVLHLVPGHKDQQCYWQPDCRTWQFRSGEYYCRGYSLYSSYQCVLC